MPLTGGCFLPSDKSVDVAPKFGMGNEIVDDDDDDTEYIDDADDDVYGSFRGGSGDGCDGISSPSIGGGNGGNCLESGTFILLYFTICFVFFIASGLVGSSGVQGSTRAPLSKTRSVTLRRSFVLSGRVSDSFGLLCSIASLAPVCLPSFGFLPLTLIASGAV